MALIKCPDCGKECSEYAESSVNCGFPFKRLFGDLSDYPPVLRESKWNYTLDFDAVDEYEIKTIYNVKKKYRKNTF